MATPETEANKRIARRFPEEVATEGNIDLINEICTDDVIDHNPLGDMRGREELIEHIKYLQVAFADVSATVEDILAEGETVAMRVTLRGRHDGQFMDVEPTGNEFGVSNMVFTRIADGQIAERWVQPDMLGLLEQLGVVETAAPMASEEQERMRDAWNELAPGFDEFGTPLSLSLGEATLDFVELDSETQFLDIAAGSGGLSIPAARTGAQVVAIDVAPNMIEHLRARARAEGLSNLEGHVMDGYALDLKDDTFDITGSQNGVSLFPDFQRGLREMVRVTMPGGRVLLVAAGPPQKAEWLRYFMDAMEAEVPDFTGIPMDPPPPTFQVADPGKLRQELTEAGLADVQVETIIWNMEFQSGKHLLDVVENTNPIGAELVGDLPEQQRSAVKEAVDTTLQERSEGGSPAALSTEMNVGIGTK